MTVLMPDGKTEFYLSDWWRHCPVQRTLEAGGIYEPRETEFVMQNANSDWTFLDLGAHVGYFTLLAAPLFKRVIAIEPHPKNYAALVKNTERFPNVTTINKAVWKHGGTVAMDLPDNSTVMSNVQDLLRLRKYMTQVPCDTLATILGDTFPEFIKADIEGSEDAVFRACPEYLDKARVLLIEYHEMQLRRTSKIESVRDFIDLLAEHGFDKLVYSESRVPVNPDKLPPSNSMFLNLLGLKEK